VLEVHLGTTGEIESVRVARDISSLTQQALQAIKEWRFRPAMLNGKLVKSVLPVAFIFVRPDLYPWYGGGQPKH
jgi:TonB family protein